MLKGSQNPAAGMSKTEQSALVSEFRRNEHVLFASLFGSTSQETNSAVSDIDLAVFVADPRAFSFADKLHLHSCLCRALGRDDIDLVIVNQTRNLLLLDQIIATGIVIYCADTGALDEFVAQTQQKVIDFKHHRHREMAA